MKWDFIISGALPGDVNMSLDISQAEALAESLKKGEEGRGHFRIYAWEKPTLSLGKYQVLSPVIRKQCEYKQIPIVRRPTGGRAVLHANELTYCIVMPCSSMEMARKAYQEIHSFFLDALTLSDFDHLDFAKTNADFQEHYTQQISSACFSASARYELTHEGKKLMGSAQRVFDGVLLQHGSLPLDQSYLNISELLTDILEEQNRIRQSLSAHSTSLADCTKKSYTFSDIADIIQTTWKERKGIL